MKKRVAGFLAVTAAGALAAGATVSAAPSSESAVANAAGGVCVPKKKIGIVDVIAASPIDFKSDQMAMMIAKRLGWSYQFVDANGDPAKAATAVQSFVDQKVDMILDVSVDAAPIRTGLQAAQKAKIPVFEVNSGNQPSPLFVGMYNENETTMGKILADYIIKTAPGGAKIGDLTTKVTYAGGLRDAALHKAVDASGGKAQILATNEIGGANPAVETSKVVTDQLTAHSDINSIFAVFDYMAAPAINAIRVKGANDKTGVYSYFTTPANLKFLRTPTTLKAVADANLPFGVVIAFDQYLKNIVKKQKIDPKALAKAGGMTYKVVDRNNVPKSGEVFTNTGTLAPYWKQWQKAYTC
jgi:ABC-type sugar transport system substrate-binding protein